MSFATEKKRDSKAHHGGKWFKNRPHNYEALMQVTERISNWLGSFNSERTKINYGNMLTNFLMYHNITNPDSLLDMDIEQLKSKVRAYHDVKKTSAPSITEHLVIILKSLLSYYEKPPLKFRRGEFSFTMVKGKTQRIPTNPEVFNIASAIRVMGTYTQNKISGLRNKAIVLFLFSGGFRDGTLPHFTIKDIYNFVYPEPQFCAVLKVTDDMDSKLRLTAIPYYFSGCSKECLTAIREYLDKRKELFGNFETDDPLFCTEYSSKLAITVPAFQISFAKAIQSAGFTKGSVWPHLLRKSFERALVKAAIDPDLREGMKGHRITGVKGHYWDYHNPDIIEEVYHQVDFSPSGAAKMSIIESKMDLLARENTELRNKVATLEKTKGGQVSGMDIIDALSDPVIADKIKRILTNGSY